jgi:hypothetical protein
MKHIKYPNNSPELVIVPSNEKGTGFLRTCYDPRYLSGIMKEVEFTYIIDVAAKINAKVYSEKRLADISGTPKIFIWLLILSYTMTLAVFVALYMTLGSKYGKVLSEVCYALLSGSIIIVIGVMITNFCKKKAKSIPYHIMVKTALDEYFGQINRIYERRGLTWSVVKGHYWIQLVINRKGQKAQMQEAGPTSPNGNL